MELRLASAFAGSIGLDLLVMPRGDTHLEVVEPGDIVVIRVFRGLLYSTYQGPHKGSRRRVVVSPGSWLTLLQPGTYSIFAERMVWGGRFARGGSAGGSRYASGGTDARA